ncbi:MAG TPA: NADP-dependent oxidoreductase [Flavobacteriaceae bacterium]|nr:NADP-dependent oxidoreductase [Flavobacteriaceae bacterium]|tara:strand:+ start:3214 stop:4209 length:996 start_codon:yes stop_codon:yes gene_type:complete
MITKKLLLTKRPQGLPTKDCWKLEEEALPKLNPGQVLIQQHYISLDPAMRGWMNDSRSYIPPVALGEVMRAGSVGQVIEVNGKTPFQEGDYVTGWGGVQTHCITNGEGFYPINPKWADLPHFIGSLGMPGMTAYFGILQVGEIQEGDTVLVSGAAGAVGSVVGQIAKIKGCKVVGIAGGPDKCTYLMKELGFDGAIDYKSENLKSGIKKYCPKGIDVYFDNVGGDILDTALIFLRKKARVVICGAISQYNEQNYQGPKNYLSLLVNRASMRGMVVLDYAAQYREAMQHIAQWMAEGKLKSKVTIYEGIEEFYPTFLRLFNGDKLGKLILKL